MRYEAEFRTPGKREVFSGDAEPGQIIAELNRIIMAKEGK